MTKFCDLLAIPLAIIFNQTLSTLEWPTTWKSETVHVIPKNSSPSSISELRNLSCTPLFSKVLESFVLSLLQSEVKLSDKQYGGLRECSTEHFLIDTWDTVINGLEQGDSAMNLVSIDFEKAFNRMDHGQCLRSLTSLGASEESVNYVSAFLFGRQMSVKINSVFSQPRLVPGGAPQGSILGGFLFCATTDQFAQITLAPPVRLNESVDFSENGNNDVSLLSEDEEQLVLSSTPEHRLTPGALVSPRNMNDSSEPEEDLNSYDFFGVRRRVNLLDSTLEEPDSFEEIIVPDSTCNDEVKTLVYIDDYNSIERVTLANAQRHITTNKQKICVHAKKSEQLFGAVGDLATNIGMRVNTAKTQMLCISPNTHSIVSSYISAGQTRIESTNSLKILGFNFDTKPDASFHVTGLIDKFYARLRTLRFLKRSGMGKNYLIKVYKTVILPAIEYCSVVYDSMIPEYLPNELESVQKRAIKIMFGWDSCYRDIIDSGQIETLKARRTNNVLKFALKSEQTARFADKWFVPNIIASDRQVRESTRRKYKLKKNKTSRAMSNPVYQLTKILNEQC